MDKEGNGIMPGKPRERWPGLRRSPKIFLTTKLLLLAVLILLPCFSACAQNTLPPKPPLTLPFAVQKAGNKVETDLRIVEHRPYYFRLRFSFKEHDQDDRARVKKLVGDDYQDKYGAPGIPTPLRLKVSVIDPAGERLLVDKDIQDLRLRSWGGDSFSKHIDIIKLKPGIYRVSVESLQDAPELVGTPTALVIYYDPNSTTLPRN